MNTAVKLEGMKGRLEMVSPNEIYPYEANAKKHPPEQIDALANIIARDHFDTPIVVDKHYSIIKGHGRRLAALQLGLKKVPVLVRDDLTPKQVRAARLSDNQVVLMGDMDMTALTKEISEIMAMEGDLDISIEDMGFDAGSLDLSSMDTDDLGFIPPSESAGKGSQPPSEPYQDNPQRDLSQPDLSQEQTFKELRQVIVDCPTEADQEIVYNLMADKGYVARVLTI
jgi:hypothetical protein